MDKAPRYFRVLIFAFFVIFIPYLAIAHLSDRCNLSGLVKQWVGKYPIDGSRNFTSLPEIKEKLEQLIGKHYAGRLFYLEREPYYLLEPITFLESNFVLNFIPNVHFNSENDTLIIIISSVDCSMHAVHIFEDGKVTWKHAGHNAVPLSVVRRFNLPAPK